MSSADNARASQAATPALSLRARGISRRFGARVALHPLDMELSAGGALAVLGPNGAGKSTLLRLLAGLMRPTSGVIEIGDGGGLNRVARRAAIGLVGHESFNYRALTLRENLELAARLHGLADVRARAGQSLAKLGLAGFAERRVADLSHGLQRRLAIARALLHEPRLLLLDEPTSGLDPRAAARLGEHLRERATTTGAACVLVTHDLNFAAALSQQALVLVRGHACALPEAALADAATLAQACSAAVARLEAAA